MPLAAILTWIANHIGLGSVKNVTGIRKDLVDTKKAKLETKKLERELDPPLVKPPTDEDIKKYDPKYQQIEAQLASQRAKMFSPLSIIIGLILLFLFILGVVFLKLDLPINK